MNDPTFRRWRPQDANFRVNAEPGSIVAFNFKPWRVIDIRTGVEHRDHPGITYTVYRLRPIDAGDCADRDEHRGWTPRSLGPIVLNDHYGLCVHCGELLPCREIMAARAAADAAREMARFDTPGVCPACQEPVTHRQAHETFSANVMVPLGPPVTFHAGRRACRAEMEQYRQRLAEESTQMTLDLGDTAT